MSAPSSSLGTRKTQGISKETIRVAADAVGVELTDEVIKGLSSEVTYRIFEIAQEAAKFAKHSKRERVTTEDVNNALRMKNVDMVYGYGMKTPVVFKKTPGTPDLFSTEDRELSLEEVISQTRLGPLPFQPSYGVHWLAIDGVQPEIPQNPKRATKSLATKDSGAKTESLILEEPEVKPSIRHVLSKELQEFYEKLTDSILNGEDAPYKAALSAMASDPGIHQLLPYFCQFVSTQVAHSLQNLPILNRMLNLVHSILVNPNIHVDQYLHQLIPVVLTCLVGKRLCENPTENHWALRDHAAEIVGLICNRWGAEYTTIQPRIVKTLVHAFVDVKRPLTTHYGAIVGLNQLGHSARSLFILPNLDRYFKYLLPILSIDIVEHPVKRAEGTMVFQALLKAAGQYLFEASKSYDRGEQVLLQSAGGVYARPFKMAKGADGKPQSTIDSVLRSVAVDDLVPLAQNYSHMYSLFGESIFPYVTRRYDDEATSLFI